MYFLESLYINLKTNTVNGKSVNFPAIYYNVLKHERSLSVIPYFLEFVFLLNAFFACKFANSHHASFTLYFYAILSPCITVFLCISM